MLIDVLTTLPNKVNNQLNTLADKIILPLLIAYFVLCIIFLVGTFIMNSVILSGIALILIAWPLIGLSIGEKFNIHGAILGSFLIGPVVLLFYSIMILAAIRFNYKHYQHYSSKHFFYDKTFDDYED